MYEIIAVFVKFYEVFFFFFKLNVQKLGQWCRVGGLGYLR